MKRNFKRILVAIIAVVALVFGSGMSVLAFSFPGNLTDKLDSVNKIGIMVDTRLNSHNDYERTIFFSATHNEIEPDDYFADLNYKLLDSGLSEEKYRFNPRNSDSSDDAEEASESNKDALDYKYSFKLRHGTLDELKLFTSTLLPGSTVSVATNEDQIGPFNDSYTISESLSYAGICNDMDVVCVNLKCNYIGFETAVATAGGTVDGNTLSYVNKEPHLRVAPVEFEFSNSLTYSVEDISVVTDVSSANILSVAVVLDFANVTDASGKTYSVGSAAANHFIDYVRAHEDSRYNHPRLRLETYAAESTASLTGETADSTSVDTDYRLVLRTEGNFEDVSETLASVFGKGNSLTLSSGKVNSSNFLYDRNSIVHSVDLTTLYEDANFKPAGDEPAKGISYSFSGSVGSGLLDLSIGSKSVDIKDNTAIGMSDGPVFKVVVDYEALDIGTLIMTIIAGAGLLCLTSFIIKLIRRRSGKKRQIKSEDIRYEAVKSVALALVPEQERSEMLEVPSELINRPTIVIKPKSDDGLDDDDDDPESVVLFSMMLRILLTVQLVLFFFPYFNVTKTNLLDSVTNITGLDLFQGFELGDVAIEPNRFAIVLFVLPLVMLICLLARRSLPKLALPVAISAGSVFSIFYLISLNNSIYDTLSPAIEAAANSGSFVSQPSSQTGFDYSIVIYIILAIGGIVLLLSNIMAMLALRRHQHDEEMRRFEK
ncbi:MAG: hypothetical protein E7554_10425 [Ruminococcaceae bacterium]|nr:hypothetical protein [Oscillospiraceae bacterium]